MTITLTTQELNTFQAKLTEWYQNELLFIFEGLRSYSHRPDYLGDTSAELSKYLKHRMEEFKKQNPRPDWRSLL